MGVYLSEDWDNMSTAETLQFQAEAKQVLDLMIHSLYTNKDIFLRELISNASDALDRLRVESLTNPDLLGKDELLEITIESDHDARTISVHDSGIGMSRDEVIEHIGTIAKSGTRELLENLKGESGDLAEKMIGQFGVGFYSTFMVADSVSLLTRRAGEEKAILWESSGDGQYTLSEGEKFRRGTSITLHLKPVDTESGIEDFTEEWIVKRIVKQYSDFVTYPIEYRSTGKDAEEKKDEDTGPINSMKPIWARPPSEVTEEEHKEFYKHVSHDWNEPLKHFSFKAEGRIEYQSLLYLPSQAPMDLFFDTGKFGLQLYVRKVLIMENCEDLLPRHLRFVKGLVDSSDLPLNISRQRLQEDRHIAQIRKWITKKVIETLGEMSRNDSETYVTFWKQFGRVLKEGLSFDYENKDKLTPLLLFDSSHDKENLTNLQDYVNRMQSDQEEIFYLSGDSRTRIENSPHLEALRERNLEVLYLSDPVDELMVQALPEFDGKKLKSIGKGTVGLGSDEEQNTARKDLNAKSVDHVDLLGVLKTRLEKHVKEVRLTNRLTDSPACLVVADEDFSPHMHRILQAQQGKPQEPVRIMELNPEHDIVQKLHARLKENKDDPAIGDFADLLFGYAMIAEGSELPDPTKFNHAIAKLMVDSI
jgi:molecular chaperone HtpG